MRPSAEDEFPRGLSILNSARGPGNASLRSMPFARTTDTGVPTEPVQFIAPRSAIDAIDVGAIIREATNDGVARSQIDVRPFGAHVGWAQVTCPVEMTLRLVNAWREAAGRTAIDEDGEERLAALRRAAVAAYRAYDDVRGKPVARHRR